MPEVPIICSRGPTTRREAGRAAPAAAAARDMVDHRRVAGHPAVVAEALKSVTTPSGSGPAWPMRSAGAAQRSNHITSVLPPPMSTITTWSASGCRRAASNPASPTAPRPPGRAARARCRWRGPPRSMNSGPFAARRQASVATQRAWLTRWRSITWAHTRSADSVRCMAVSLSRFVAAKPSPRRTMREKLSTTRKPSPCSAATSRRQLLVPRSSAPRRAPTPAASLPCPSLAVSPRSPCPHPLQTVTVAPPLPAAKRHGGPAMRALRHPARAGTAAAVRAPGRGRRSTG